MSKNDKDTRLNYQTEKSKFKRNFGTCISINIQYTFSFRFQMHGGSLLDDLTSFCWRKSKTNKIRVMSIMARQNSPNNEGKNFDLFYHVHYSIFQDNFQFSSERLFIQKTY